MRQKLKALEKEVELRGKVIERQLEEIQELNGKILELQDDKN